MNLQERRQKYADLCDRQAAIIDSALTEGRTAMADGEKAAYENLQTQIDGMGDLITKAEAVQARAAALDEPVGSLLRPSSIVVGNDLAASKPWGSFGDFLLAVYDAEADGLIPRNWDKRIGFCVVYR